MTTSRTWRERASWAAACVALAICAACALAAAPGNAYADTTYYDLNAQSASGLDADDYGFYGIPGEKLTYKLSTLAWDENNNTQTVKGLTYAYSGAKKLGGKLKGSKLTFKKLPKAGTYKFTIKAKDKSGKVVATWKYKFIVKKKPSVKLKIRTTDANYKVISNNAKKAKKSDNITLCAEGAYFGWDNNKKKNFTVWTVKNLKTGKTAKWDSKKRTFKNNSFVNGAGIAGGDIPYLLTGFKKKGTYEITVDIYHSDKKIASSTKKLTVK